MPRYYGGSPWPYTFVHQPGGWAEQTFGVGYGNRNGTLNNDMFASQCGGVDHGAINLDRLSGLVTRLVLQNHLTRPDAGCRGGALWGCTPPPPPPCHGSAHVDNGCRLPCVHTCPGTTQPYMATNNVFVIPANLVHQQPQVGATVPPGTTNLNNINMLLGGLGLGLGAVNPACGGGLSLPCGLNTTHGSGAGLGAQLNPNRPSCPSCHGHL